MSESETEKVKVKQQFHFTSLYWTFFWKTFYPFLPFLRKSMAKMELEGRKKI